MSALVTVVIPVRNGAAYVRDAIESARVQDVPGLAILVSDNQSSDATPEILAEYAASDPRVRVVRQPEGLGMTTHFNRCLELVDTPYYMLLCHDDYLASPDALRKAQEALAAHPEVAAVYCDLEYVDAQRRRIALRRFRRAGVIDSDALARDAVVAHRNLFGIPLLVRTAAVAGLSYDDDLAYAGDLDLSIAVSKGGRIFHVPEPLIANRYHGGNATLGLFRAAAGQMDRIARKHAIPLTAFDRVRMSVTAWTTAFTKWAFFRWLGLRS